VGTGDLRPGENEYGDLRLLREKCYDNVCGVYDEGGAQLCLSKDSAYPWGVPL
jgi:hypothetical protein